MKVAIFGATGKTGQHITRMCLHDYEISVKALVRNPSKIPTHQQFEAVQGDIRNLDNVRQTISGCDAIICVIGHKFNDKTNSNLEEMAIKNIVQVAKELGIKQVIYQSGYTGNKPGDLPFWMQWGMNLTNLKNIYRDKHNAENVLINSGLDWTIVRPTFLTNGNLTNKYQVVEGLRISWYSFPRVSRQDVAHFIVSLLSPEQGEWLQRKPIIYS